jgi:hypothetical protein
MPEVRLALDSDQFMGQDKNLRGSRSGSARVGRVIPRLEFLVVRVAINPQPQVRTLCR